VLHQTRQDILAQPTLKLDTNTRVHDSNDAALKAEMQIFSLSWDSKVDTDDHTGFDAWTYATSLASPRFH